MKTCKDFEYTGVECCMGCHYEEEAEDLLRPLIAIRIDGEEAYVCCEIASFFYPDGSWKDASREGKRGQWDAARPGRKSSTP